MQKINKLSAALLGIALLFGMVVPTTTHAATDPGLGAAEPFSIIAQTAITGTGTISGDVGINSTGAGITDLTDAMVGGTIYSTDGVAPSTAILSASVQANLSTANDNMTGQASTASIGPALDGETRTTGVYDIGAGRLNGGVLTLDGPGIYIFRASSDFISSGSVNLINGARACDVYWQVASLATINGSSFVGTIIAGTGVHFGSGVTLNGRALALGGDVTLLNTTISEPTCEDPPQLVVNKVVVNDNGGTKVIADFPLFLNGASVTSGVATTTTAGTHTVTETSDSGYATTFGGDCASDGTITLAAGDVKTCTVTNNDIAAVVAPVPSSGGSSGSYSSVVPPLIEVVKVPSPLTLPNGPGPVTYTYTLSNIGTVPVNDITMVGDTCSPITLISGDLNLNQRLEVDEVWEYTCTTTLSKTHTNIITATGWANGISATDIAQATVVVGLSSVPPLIKVTKVPSPIVLPVGGGNVVYANKVTNPGTVALSNVKLSDDKCSPVTYISGDTNGDGKLDPNETWVYVCHAYLTQTTVNTISASGEANGLTAKDYAIATVIVGASVPSLPNTGLPFNGRSIPWYVVIPGGFVALLTLIYIVRMRQTA
ncbi:hypothetical protein A3C87_03420 [Candidatus Kaiserbacteria bacterium RIFCSPHIGHO2_02_FULL_49_34]|uniref:DUF7507 domain-containing protein n=1 Tax=Candidatus Kaiserbacteria bacterium RIFCSPHIGHO2_02_FULL_49_34 TaxID=1798491 RepID=A0A1F6DID4_9BACT|nr:MAG: hypothetical protein A3C87_03420 [Candidatus Kaiserbacteria bacterium RIFCSPHIGHO2_02_FULL_49_34]